MNAMIFAAGLGTRLRPLTDHRPKALVEVAGRPLLAHLIDRLKAAGFDHLVVNVHHFADQIIDYLHAHDDFGLDIRISDERDRLLDTGGGLRRALPLFDDPTQPILVHNADIVSTVDLAALYRRAAEAMQPPLGAAGVLAVQRRPTSRYLLIDPTRHTLCGWVNTQSGQVRGDVRPDDCDQRAFAGIHVVGPALFPLLAAMPTDVFSIIDFYLQTCKNVTLLTHELPADVAWADCGKPETLARAAAILSAQP